MLDFYKFIFHYINDHDPHLLNKAIQAYENQEVTAESAATGGE